MKDPLPQDDALSPRLAMFIGVALAAMGAASVAFLIHAVLADAAITAAGGPDKGLSARATSSAASPAPELPTAEEEIQGAFYVGDDLAASYKGVFQDGILDLVNEQVGDRLPTEAFKPGSAVRILVTAETAPGGVVRYKHLMAIEVKPPPPAVKPVRFYAFDGQKAGGYFDDSGRQPASTGWQAPLAGPMRRTSPFNPKRMHPVLHKIMPHNGTDFGATTGTPVYAAYEGTVDFIGPSGATGNWVSIVHPNGIETGYAHLSRFAQGIKRGDHVRTHQLIGYVGSTGRSTGPHLHFSARKDGAFFNAETLLAQGERQVPESERSAFLLTKARLDNRLDTIALPPAPPLPPPPPAEKAAPPSPPPHSSASHSRPIARGHRSQR